MNIAMNAVSLLSPATGIASYTRNLAHALLQTGQVQAFFFYGFSWSDKVRDAPVPALVPAKNLVKKILPYSYEASRFVQQWIFRRGVNQYPADIYHEPNYIPFRFDGPTVITVHDLSHIRYAHTHPAARVRIMNKLLPRAIETVSEIIVDSHFVGREVIGQFGVAPGKVHAIHLGVSQDYRPRAVADISQQLLQYGLLPKSYILAVGTLEPRKNLIQAIDAFAGLPEAVRKATPLVIAGMKGWLSGQLEARISLYESRGEVRWLGYVPAQDLPLLYSGASMLVYPSLYEGFGFPVLEAMASGIPVITSDRASLPEVAGDVGIMVDPEDVDGLRGQMRRLIEDKTEADRRGALGVERARQFTWQVCAEKTLAVYKQAMGSGKWEVGSRE